MREYVKPTMEGELFAANEYVATCGEMNEVYKFVCDAGGGTYGTVYEDTNKNGRFDFGDEPLTGIIIPTYHACGKTHEAPTNDDFLDGFYCPDSLVLKAVPVKIWTDGGTNIHCTTKIEMDKWETVKS